MTIALTGIVLSIVFSIYFLGHKMFSIGTDRSSIQSNIRISAEYITKNVRSAKDLSANEENLKSNNYSYYALTVSGGNLMHRTFDSGSMVSEIIVCPIDEIKFSSSIDNMLNISIKEKQNAQKQDAQFSIKLLNLKTVDIPEETGTIYYTKY